MTLNRYQIVISHKFVITVLLITTLVLGSTSVTAEIDGTDVWEEDGSITWGYTFDVFADPSIGSSYEETGRITATYLGLSGSDMEFEIEGEIDGTVQSEIELIDRQSGETDEGDQSPLFMDVEDLEEGDDIPIYLVYTDSDGTEKETDLGIDGEGSYSMTLDGETEEIDVWIASAERRIDYTDGYFEYSYEVEFSKSSGTILKEFQRILAVLTDGTELLDAKSRIDATDADGLDMTSGFFEDLPISPIPIVLGLVSFAILIRLKRIVN